MKVALRIGHSAKSKNYLSVVAMDDDGVHEETAVVPTNGVALRPLLGTLAKDTTTTHQVILQGMRPEYIR